MRLIIKWSQRIVTHIDAVAVDIEFRSRSSILKIIPAIMFRHPRTFNISVYTRIQMILPKPLPAVNGSIGLDQLGSLTQRKEPVIEIELPALYREHVGRSPVNERLPVIIQKKIRVLKIMQDGRHCLPHA